MSGIRIETICEHELPGATEDQLRALLDVSFPDTFAGRTYFKQLPHVRLLAWDGLSLVGQVGFDHRIVNVAGNVLAIFGVIDLCVVPHRRGTGIGSAMLDRAAQLAAKCSVDFLVAMADLHDFYRSRGYQRVQPALATWLAIEDRQSVTLIERDLSDCFMVKPVTKAAWPAGKIDLLGYLF